MLFFLLIGIFIGIIFDFFRSLRKKVKTSDSLTYIQDTIFFIISGILILYSMYKFNSGEVRLYIFIGILLGILLYFCILSKYVMRIFVIVIEILERILNKIFSPIIIIINFLLKISKRIFNKIRYNNTKKYILFKKLHKNSVIKKEF